MKQFTKDTSHELRAPITRIRTTAEIAAQKRNRNANEYLDALDGILEESERTSQVVDSLMLLARADAGKEVLERGLVDVSSISHAAVEQAEKLARIRGLHFTSSIPDVPIWVHADAEVFRRAVLIFIDNAGKYTPEGGLISVDLSTTDGFARLTVSDTGIGIAPADLTHVFDRFWRADKARSRSHGESR